MENVRQSKKYQKLRHVRAYIQSLFNTSDMTTVKKMWNTSKGIKYVKQPTPQTKQKRDRHKKLKGQRAHVSESSFNARILRSIGYVADGIEFLTWLKAKAVLRAKERK